MSEKFIVTKKLPTNNEKSVTFTIRIDRALQEKYDKLAFKSDRSRNELINLALEYALKNLEFVGNTENES